MTTRLKWTLSTDYTGMMGTRTSFRAGNLQSDCIKVKKWLARQDYNLEPRLRKPIAENTLSIDITA